MLESMDSISKKESFDGVKQNLDFSSLSKQETDDCSLQSVEMFDSQNVFSFQNLKLPTRTDSNINKKASKSIRKSILKTAKRK